MFLTGLIDGVMLGLLAGRANQCSSVETGPKAP